MKSPNLLGNIEQEFSLAPLTSLQVGGPAEFFSMPKDELQVESALKFAQEKALPIHILGAGTNVLISDQGIKGLTICMKKMTGTVITEEGERLKITCQSGTSKSDLLKIFLKHKRAPALFLAGIPGDLGGGVAMNAGVGEMFHPREFTSIVDWVEVIKPDLKKQTYQHDELQWAYRHCRGWEPGVILRVGILWQEGPVANILEQVKAANQSRLSKQPLDLPNCGSVFVNPPGLKAAQLIDSCQMKGYTIGGAQVSTKHANFIVNLGGAKAKDIWDLIQKVREVVVNKTGVELKTEVELMGNFSQKIEFE